MSKIHKKLLVIGLVQGVYFRVSVMNFAIQRGITGYVCNRKDGNVYLEAEGTEEQINDLIDWCEEGPSKAVVEKVKVADGPMSNYEDFHIHYGS